MSVQPGRLDLDQVRLHVLDDAIPHVAGQKVDNRLVKLSRSGERPAGKSVALDDFGNLVGQFPVNAAIGLVLQLRFGNGGPEVSAGAIGRVPAGLVGHVVAQFAMRFGRIKGLDQVQTGSARGRFIHPIGFQASAIRNNDERSRSHGHNILQ